MPSATLSRGSTSITFQLWAPGGEPVIARDTGKPRQTLPSVGRTDPKVQDNFSGAETFTVSGYLEGSNAYSDAKTLAETIIKPRVPSGQKITLDLSALSSLSTYEVAPVTEDALTLTYSPGERDLVGIDLSVSRVSGTVGGAQTGSTTSSPYSGSGVTIDRNGTSVTITDDLTVTRKVGRSEDKVLPVPSGLPKYYSMNTPGTDIFEVSGELTGANAYSDADTLAENIVRPPLGNQALVLSFNGSLYNLDAYDVVAEGSGAVRSVYEAGEADAVSLPTLKFRAVDA